MKRDVRTPRRPGICSVHCSNLAVAVTVLRKLPIGGLARPRPVNSVFHFPLLPRCLLWSSSSLRNVKGTFCESRSIRSSAPSLLCRCPKSFVPASMMQPRSNSFSSTNHHQNPIVLHSISQHFGLTLEPNRRLCSRLRFSTEPLNRPSSCTCTTPRVTTGRTHASPLRILAFFRQQPAMEQSTSPFGFGSGVHVGEERLPAACAARFRYCDSESELLPTAVSSIYIQHS